MATGPTRAQMANIPSWVKSIGESYPEERLQHTVQLMHHLPATRHKFRDTGVQRQEEAEGESSFFIKICITFPHLCRILKINSCFLQRFQCSDTSVALWPHPVCHKYYSPSLESCVVCKTGERVMVVGGGLTSAHVISIALQQGASHVTWVMRKHLQVQWPSKTAWRPSITNRCRFTCLPLTHVSVLVVSPTAKTVWCGRRGEPGGSLLPRGTWHQDGRPSLSATVLQWTEPPQTTGYDSPGKKRRGRHPRGLHPPAAFHPERTVGCKDILWGTSHRVQISDLWRDEIVRQSLGRWSHDSNTTDFLTPSCCPGGRNKMVLQEPGLASLPQHWGPLARGYDLARHWLQTWCQAGPVALWCDEGIPHCGGLKFISVLRLYCT